jgi:hypothetical protein
MRGAFGFKSPLIFLVFNSFFWNLTKAVANQSVYEACLQWCSVNLKLGHQTLEIRHRKKYIEVATKTPPLKRLT